MIMKRLLFYLFLVSPFISLQAQQKDAELWLGGNFNVKLNKKFQLGIKEQFRFNNNMASFKKELTELGLKYKINKHFAVKPGFRYVIVGNKNNQRRFFLDGFYKWSKKDFPLSLQYRLRYQSTKNFNSNKNTTNYLRNKLEVEYNLSKLADPFVSYELYFRFNQKNEFRVARFTMGVDWKLNKRMSLATFYRLQKDIGSIKLSKRNTSHIFGVIYSYGMKMKK